jgi:hypothetical protein
MNAGVAIPGCAVKPVGSRGACTLSGMAPVNAGQPAPEPGAFQRPRRPEQTQRLTRSPAPGGLQCLPCGRPRQLHSHSPALLPICGQQLSPRPVPGADGHHAQLLEQCTTHEALRLGSTWVPQPGWVPSADVMYTKVSILSCRPHSYTVRHAVAPACAHPSWREPWPCRVLADRAQPKHYCTTLLCARPPHKRTLHPVGTAGSQHAAPAAIPLGDTRGQQHQGIIRRRLQGGCWAPPAPSHRLLP